MHWGKTDLVGCHGVVAWIRLIKIAQSQNIVKHLPQSPRPTTVQSVREKRRKSIACFLSQPSLHNVQGCDSYPCFLQWNEFLGGPAQYIERSITL